MTAVDDTGPRVPLTEEKSSRAALREKLQSLKENKEGLARKIGELRRHHGLIERQIVETELAIGRLSAEPRVSDHAVLRYIHRVVGINLDDIREKILSDGMREAVRSGAEKVIRDGYEYCISRDGCITTIVGPDRSEES